MAAQAIATTGHPVGATEEAIKLTDTPTAGMEEPISIGQPAGQTCSPQMEACGDPAHRATEATTQNNGVSLLHGGCRVTPCGLTRPTQPPLPTPCPSPFHRSHPHALQRAEVPESPF